MGDLASAALFMNFVATSVARFVAVEVLRWSLMHGMFVPRRHRAVVAGMGIKMVVYMAAEAFWAMEPRADANKHAAVKEFRSIVSVGSARLGRVIVQTVGGD